MNKKFFISGVRNIGNDCERVDDINAEYFTVYQRNDDNTSSAICDCSSREQAEMVQRAKAVIEVYVNGCHCKNNDDVLHALSVLTNMTLNAGDAVKNNRQVTLQ